MPDVTPNFKEPKGKRAKGRARPDDPLNDRCEFPGCFRPAEERHHIVRRSQGGTDDETADVCSHHHLWIHSNVARSEELGLLKRSWAS